MPAATEPQVICRCGAWIVPASGDSPDWRALTGERPGDYHCPGGKLHRPAVPVPPTRDSIARWDEVRVGDQVIGFHGVLEPVTALPPEGCRAPKGCVSVEIGGVWFSPRRDKLTAVRRYKTGGGSEVAALPFVAAEIVPPDATGATVTYGTGFSNSGTGQDEVLQRVRAIAMILNAPEEG